MKKMFIKTPFVLRFYVVYLIGAVLWALGLFIFDSFTMPPQQTLTLQNFTQVGFEQLNENTLVAVDGDPQLIIDGTNIRTISYTLSQGGKGAVCAYYTKNAQQNFSNKMRLWPAFGQTQSGFYTFARSGVHTIRLDVTNETSDIVQFENIEANVPMAFYQYFVPSTTQIAAFFVLPGFVAALAMFLCTMIRYYIKKEREC